MRDTLYSGRVFRTLNVLDELKRRLSPTELVELVASTAAYNMVARFLVALEVVRRP